VSSTGGAVVVSEVREVPLTGLREYEGYPRVVVPGRLEDLKLSLLEAPEMCWAHPLWQLPDGRIISGRERWLAALALGWDRLPAVTISGLTRQQELTYMLRANASYGTWLEPNLRDLLAELRADGIDVLLSGLEPGRIDELLAGVPTLVDPDEAPPLPEGEPESQTGAIYSLGEHRLLCGDCQDAEQLAALLAGEAAVLLVADPPYGVNYRGKTAAALRIANDEPEQLRQLLERALTAAGTVLAPRVPFYLSAPAGPAGTEFRLVLRHIGWEHRQSLAWVKSSFVLGHADFHYQHEELLFGYTPGTGRQGRGVRDGRWYGGNAQSSVLFADRPRASRLHPTMKPIALIEQLLRCSSRRGDLVLDPFCGSGSTLIACERLGRRCAAVEVDPRYADVIRRRYEEQTHGQ